MPILALLLMHFLTNFCIVIGENWEELSTNDIKIFGVVILLFLKTALIALAVPKGEFCLI